MTRLALTIPGDPVAQGRPRMAVVNGRPRAYDPPKSRAWKAAAHTIAAAEMRRAGLALFVGPLRVAIVAVFACPKWAHRKRNPAPRTPRTGRPDADNVAKACLDAIQGAVMADDSQVYDLHILKWTGAQDEPAQVSILVEGQTE